MKHNYYYNFQESNLHSGWLKKVTFNVIDRLFICYDQNIVY